MTRGRGRYYGNRRVTPDDAPGMKRDLRNARARGDNKTVERVSKRYTQLSMKLYGGTTDKDKGEPFDDPIPF